MRNSVNVRLLGNWKGAVAAYATMRPEIKRAISLGQRRYARRLVSTVKRHIIAQDLPWAAASRSKRGSVLMIDSRTYYGSIKFWQKNYELYVGVPKHFISPRTGQPIWKIATWQEKGTKNIPARPLWGPSIEEVGGETQCFVEVKDEIFDKLAKLGIGIWQMFET